MVTMGIEIQSAFDEGVARVLLYKTRYAHVNISHTLSGLVCVEVDGVSRYYYTSLAEASDMLYSLGVLVQRI